MINYREISDKIFTELMNTCSTINEGQVNQYIKLLLKADKVFFVGIGRVKISLEAAVKRLTHLGIHCVMVGELTEPPISSRDLLVVASGSGESIIPLEIARKAQQLEVNILHITSNMNSSIGGIANYHLEINAPNKSLKAENSIQPMSTLFEQTIYLLHDVITIIIIERKQLRVDELTSNHANLE